MASLIIVSKFDPNAILAVLWSKLRLSSPFSIYCEHMEVKQCIIDGYLSFSFSSFFFNFDGLFKSIDPYYDTFKCRNEFETLILGVITHCTIIYYFSL